MAQIRCEIPKQLHAAFHDETLGVRCAVTPEGVDIFLHGYVGDEFGGTDSLTIGATLLAHRGKPVTLRVNSPGGLAYDGVAIFNALDHHDGPTTGIIEGLAGSAASLAVLACDKVKCHASAVYQPHYSLIMVMGHQADLMDALLVQQRLDLDLEEIYRVKSGQTLEKIREDLTGPHGDGTVFSAEQAMAAGYVDEVIPIKSKAAADTSSRGSAAMVALRSRRIGLLTAGGHHGRIMERTQRRPQ